MNQFLEQMLSRKGQAITFPKQGIVLQSREAEGKSIDATVGTASYSTGRPLFLQSVQNFLKISPKDTMAYAPSFGKPELREYWQKKIMEQNPSIQNNLISLPVTTDGLTHGLNMAAFLFADEGDVLITPDLYWENYDLIFRDCYGIKIQTFPFLNAAGSFNIAGLEKTIAENRREGRPILLALNFPHNPTGYGLSEAEAEQIFSVLHAAASKGNNLVVLVDDAYFGLLYEDGLYQESLFGRLTHLHERILAIKIDGSSKEDFAWGLRVAFLTYGMKEADAQDLLLLEEKTAALVRASISSVSNLAQSLLLSAYLSPDYLKEKKEKINLLKNRYLAMKGAVADHPEYQEIFDLLPCTSGYFVCLKLKSGLNAGSLRKFLLEKYDTGLIAHGGMLRITFASVKEEDFPKLFENIYRAGKSL